MIAESNKFPDSTLKPACCLSGLWYGRITSGSAILACLTFSPTVLPLIVSASVWIRCAAITVGRGNGGAAGQRKSERFCERIHGGGGAHGVAMADRWHRGRDKIEEFLVVHAAGSVLLARPPHDGTGSGAFAFPPAVEHRS